MVVEDDMDLRIILEDYLKNYGYNVFAANSGTMALHLLEEQIFDLIICDVMMPEMDGYEFINLLRGANIQIPFIFLTAKGEIEDKKEGFDSGADDYLVKPVQYEELHLRIKAILKRTKMTESKIKFGNTILNEKDYTLIICGNHYHLPRKEFELLWLLSSQKSTIFTRYDILEKIWGYDSESTERTVDVHVNRLRKKMVESNYCIKTVHGLGYLFAKRSGSHA